VPDNAVKVPERSDPSRGHCAGDRTSRGSVRYLRLPSVEADSAAAVPGASAAHDTSAPTLAPGGSTGLLERAAELAAVDWLVSSASESPAALILEGEAGIGKTALWEQAWHEHSTAGLRCCVCE
jgi:hypothetical protein